jgi:hypothetical protein
MSKREEQALDWQPNTKPPEWILDMQADWEISSDDSSLSASLNSGGPTNLTGDARVILRRTSSDAPERPAPTLKTAASSRFQAVRSKLPAFKALKSFKLPVKMSAEEKAANTALRKYKDVLEAKVKQERMVLAKRSAEASKEVDAINTRLVQLESWGLGVLVPAYRYQGQLRAQQRQLQVSLPEHAVRILAMRARETQQLLQSKAVLDAEVAQAFCVPAQTLVDGNLDVTGLRRQLRWAGRALARADAAASRADAHLLPLSAAEQGAALRSVVAAEARRLRRQDAHEAAALPLASLLEQLCGADPEGAAGGEPEERELLADAFWHVVGDVRTRTGRLFHEWYVRSGKV